MKIKFILSFALLAGTAFSGFADGYLDGVEYYQAGQEENAKTVLDATLNDAGTDKAVAYYYLGNIALHKGDNAQAEKYYTLGIQANPGYAFNYIGKGAIALKRNDKNGAKDFFKEAEKLDKKDAKVKVDIARAYYMTDSVLYKKEFNEYLKDAKKKNKEEASIYIFEGDMYADQKDYGKSAGYYEMAIQYDIDRPIAYVKYADTYFHIAPDVAIAKLQEIVDKNPGSALAQRELAEKYYENNQWTKAVEQYKYVIDNPNCFPSDEARYVVLLYFAERYQESLDRAQQLLAQNQSPFLMKRMIFLNYTALENYAAAETAAQAFFASQQDSVNTFTANDYTAYATVLDNLGKTDESIAAFENALKVNPDKKELYRDLSSAYSEAAGKIQVTDTIDAATLQKRADLYKKAADAYQQFIDGGEYGKDYELHDMFTLSGRYQNVISTAQDEAVKKDAYEKGVKVIDLVLEKATSDYRIIQRKARIIRLYFGEANRTQEAVDAYLKTVEVTNADTDLTPDKKKNILNEAYLYIGSYYLEQKKDVAEAKKYYELAYELNPTPQMRSYIDGLK